jgi:hypothetical protein
MCDVKGQLQCSCFVLRVVDLDSMIIMIFSQYWFDIKSQPNNGNKCYDLMC